MYNHDKDMEQPSLLLFIFHDFLFILFVAVFFTCPLRDFPTEVMATEIEERRGSAWTYRLCSPIHPSFCASTFSTTCVLVGTSAAPPTHHHLFIARTTCPCLRERMEQMSGTQHLMAYALPIAIVAVRPASLFFHVFITTAPTQPALRDALKKGR